MTRTTAAAAAAGVEGVGDDMGRGDGWDSRDSEGLDRMVHFTETARKGRAGGEARDGSDGRDSSGPVRLLCRVLVHVLQRQAWNTFLLVPSRAQGRRRPGVRILCLIYKAEFRDPFNVAIQCLTEVFF